MKFSVCLLCTFCGYMWLAVQLCRGDDVGIPEDSHPVAGDYIPLTCWNFTVGDWAHREFYSPQYPDDYSNSTECMQLLIAPKGYRIRLDFRDEFHIEYSDGCKYDFLELRDGPFGYSQLLGRYCGKEHPPITESSSRFLWIRFKSDDSIEYKGFRAVFDFFIPDTDESVPIANPSQTDGMCRIEVPIKHGSGFLDSRDIVSSHQKNYSSDGGDSMVRMIDCTYVIYAPAKHRVNLLWPEYAMTTPQNCADSFLEIYERTTALSDRRKQLCGDIARNFKSTSNHVYIRVFAQSAQLIPLFKAVVTIYTPAPCEDKFQCGDNTCIDKNLVCNGVNNCNYGADEKNCEEEIGAILPESTTEPLMFRNHTIILSVVGASIFIIIVMSVCITCHQRKREEKRRCRALKQDERRALEMTTLINTSQGTPLHLREQAQHQNHPHHHHNTLPNHHVRNGHKNKGGADANTRNMAGCNSHREYNGTDLDPAMHDGTYRRYLEVNHYPEDEFISQTLPHNHTQIPAVVTIEKPPRVRSTNEWSRDMHDQTPSPRPDVVQEEKFLYPPDMQDHNALRRLSIDTVKSDKSDVWKPMEPKTQGYKTLDHKSKHSDQPRPPDTERRTLPRVNFNLDNLEPKRRDSRDSPSSKYSTYPQAVYSEDPYINRTVCIPPPPGSSTVYHNRPPTSSSSNNSPQLKHPPPKPPQRSPHTELVSAKSPSSPAPDMFYTRPRRTNPQAKHAAV